MNALQLEKEINRSIKSLDKRVAIHSKQIDNQIEHLMLEARQLKNNKKNRLASYRKSLVLEIENSKKELEIIKYLESQGFQKIYQHHNEYYAGVFPSNSNFKIEIKLSYGGHYTLVETISTTFQFNEKNYILYFDNPYNELFFKFSYLMNGKVKIIFNSRLIQKIKNMGQINFIKQEFIRLIKLEDEESNLNFTFSSKNIPAELISALQTHMNFR